MNLIIYCSSVYSFPPKVTILFGFVEVWTFICRFSIYFFFGRGNWKCRSWKFQNSHKWKILFLETWTIDRFGELTFRIIKGVVNTPPNYLCAMSQICTWVVNIWSQICQFLRCAGWKMQVFLYFFAISWSVMGMFWIYDV